MNVKIKKTEGAEESAEILASAIIRIANSFESLLNTSLKEEAIIALISNMPGTKPADVSKGQIQLVLKNLRRLKAWYIK
jgi:hypothetical protein